MRLTFDYLINTKHRTKLDCHYSLWKELLFEVSQRTGLRPLFFSFYLCDLFLLTRNIGIASHANDTTPYVYGESINSTIEYIEKASDLLFQWFNDNYMNANEDKCQAIENVLVNTGIAQIQNSSSEKLSRVKVDWKLNLKTL